MRKIFIYIIVFSSLTSSAQPDQNWKGKKCAVVITYVDAIDQHLDNAIPVLDSL